MTMKLQIDISEDQELRGFIKQQISQVMKTAIREEMNLAIKELVENKVEGILEQEVSHLLRSAGYIDLIGRTTDKVHSIVHFAVVKQIASNYDEFIKEQIGKEEWIEWSRFKEIIALSVSKKIDNLSTIIELINKLEEGKKNQKERSL